MKMKISFDHLLSYVRNLEETVDGAGGGANHNLEVEVTFVDADPGEGRMVEHITFECQIKDGYRKDCHEDLKVNIFPAREKQEPEGELKRVFKLR